MGSSSVLTGPLRGFGAPPDAAAWMALFGAAVALWLMVRRPNWEGVVRRRYVALVLAVAAGALSVAYVAYYLHGGPRIIDATSYWLEAQTLAGGDISMDVPGPTGSFRGRFLLTAPGSDRLVVVFPPGYPLVLALGFVLGVPLLVGPLLGALIAWVTFVFTEKLWGRRDAACAAALFSVLSAALRYHTADTMSHGWAALLLLIVVLCVSVSGPAALSCAGLAAGGLVATRPVTGVVSLALLAVGIIRQRSLRGTLGATLCVLPGLALLAWHQDASTGSPWGSSHLRYYGLADGPPGCFRYGFGAGIGCLHEHGDFVREFAPRGHGFGEGLAATARRLRLHLLDVANFEPLALAIPVAAWKMRGNALGRAATLAIVGVILGYLPFYFDGNYPGGGARLFADVLPLEHALLGGLVVHFGVTAPAVVAALLGFACHASFEHRELASREGGRPMFDAEQLEARRVERAVVFVDSDHGFNLGFQSWQPGQEVVIARYSGDAHDTELVSALGGRDAYRYSYDFRSGGARLLAYVPPRGAPFEAEADWPPLEVAEGWVERVYSASGCASGGRVLSLHPNTGRRLSAAFELYLGFGGRYRIETSWAPAAERAPGSPARIRLRGVEWEVPVAIEGCLANRGPWIRLDGGRHRLVVEVEGGDRVFDAYRAVTE